VRAAFSKLEELFCSLDDKSVRLKMLIKENYDLQSLLEETFIARYDDERESVSTSGFSFTIHENSTIHDLIRYYLQTVLQIIAAATLRQQNRKRIDVSRVSEFLRAHYTESLTLEDTAGRFNVSKEYLCSAFKKETGITFTGYLTSVRMNKAKELILEYGIPIQQVSEMVGYTDIAYFYRAFKKFFGTTPARMREDAAASFLGS
jgi:two-component system response regulator YesN